MKTNNKVRITRIFSFEAAHALKDYNGPCRHIHGHSYKLWVTVCGQTDAGTGMLMDFGDLKKSVNDSIVNLFDHSLFLDVEDTMVRHNLGDIATNLLTLPFNPTSENLVIYFSRMIINALPNNVNLHHLKLYETELSFAEWYADDNA